MPDRDRDKTTTQGVAPFAAGLYQTPMNNPHTGMNYTAPATSAFRPDDDSGVGTTTPPGLPTLVNVAGAPIAGSAGVFPCELATGASKPSMTGDGAGFAQLGQPTYCSSTALPTPYPPATLTGNCWHHMFSAAPNAEDKPTARMIELWAAVDHPSGNLAAITSVFWKVYHPDGTFKVQVQGVKASSGQGSCTLPGATAAGVTPSINGDMLTDAGPVSYNTSPAYPTQGTGQVSGNAATAMVALCRQGVKGFWSGSFDLHKYQQCGEYRVETWAVSSSSTVSTKTYYFDVPCTNFLTADFDCINWPGITPGQVNILAGDTVWNTMTGAAGTNCNPPTLKNTGNSGIGVSITLYDLVQCNTDGGPTCVLGSVPGAKKITDFDACLGRSPETIFCIDPQPTVAGGQCLLDDVDTSPTNGCHDHTFLFNGASPQGQNQVLCPNVPVKLDLSIHAPIGLPPGSYVGGGPNGTTQGQGIQITAVSPATNPGTGTGGVWCGEFGGYHDAYGNGHSGYGPNMQPVLP